MLKQQEAMVRCALAGRVLLVVGGDPRPEAIGRLKAELHLGEILHCPTRKSDASSRAYRSALFSKNLALVVCARGLCRTQHGKDLHGLCRDLDIPLLDCFRIPHPAALVAAVLVNRLVGAVVRRCERDERSKVLSLSIGGAA